jgi:hypothetical protein
MDFLGSIFAYLCKIPFSLFNLTSGLCSDFTPTVGNTAHKNKSTSKTGVIVGVVVGVTVLGLVALVGIFMWRQKRRKLSLEQQELYSIVGRPNVFSYSELRSATENFSSSNRLGEGGYGTVYKVSSSVSTYIYSKFRTCYGILPTN